MKKFLAGLSAVAVLAAGGVAMVGLTSDSASAQEETTTTDDDTVDEQRSGHRHGHRGRGLAAAAETIGIDTADLIAAVQDGSTVADVAAENGSSGQAVIDAIVAQVSERIDEAVADGTVTAEEGADPLAKITERVTDLVNGDLELPDREHRDHRGLRGRGLSTAADTIGISVADLVAGLVEGSSIADVADANGSSGQAVIDAMVANASDRIDQAVTDGELTAEEGADRLASVTERITEKVNTVPDLSERPERGFGGPRGPQGEDVVDA